MKTYIKSSLAIAVLVVAVLAVAVTASPRVRAAGPWYVKPGGNDANDCLSPATACATINGALNKPGFLGGDTIRVAVGAYTGTGDEVVLLSRDTTLSGGWNEAFTIQINLSTIDGGGSRRGITVNSGATAVVDRFIVQNGATPGSGGGIFNSGALTVTNSIIRSNYAECLGTAVFNEGTFTSINTTINDNIGQVIYCLGVAVMNMETGIMTLNNTVVSNNTPAGGIYNYGTLTLNNSTVSDNKGGGFNDTPGGIYNFNGTVTLNSSTVSGNTTYNGGGIWTSRYSQAESGTVILNNSTVSGNTATSSGGGIYASSFGGGGIVILNNSTVSGNTANTGGGIFSASGVVTLTNSILAGNNASVTGPDCNGGISSSGYNILGIAAGCVITATATDMINANPKLGPLIGSPAYHLPQAGSPAIDAGNPAGCKDHLGNPLPFDQRSAPRVGRCDIGAVERHALEGRDKAVSVSTASPGTAVTYKITLGNVADTAVDNVIVTDTLPPLLSYTSNSLSATSGSYAYSSGVITWTGSVSAGGMVKITYGAVVSQTVSLGASIANSAIITGEGWRSVHTASFDIDGPICNLTKHSANPVLAVGANGAWDDVAIWEPTVLKDGNLYKMWYAGFDGATTRIGYATSTDGVNWAKYAGNPVLAPGLPWEGNSVSDPHVMSVRTGYAIWYTGRTSAGVSTIGYATSSDGINWTKWFENPVMGIGPAGSWKDADVMNPVVLRLGGLYHMWYTGSDGMTLRIGHATSLNGFEWNDDFGNPIVDTGNPGAWDWLDVYGPSVVAYSDKYLLWYSGGTLPAAYQTGYAISTDGSNWTRQKMLIPEGPLNAFDVFSADYPAVLVDGPGYKIWYSGINSAGTYNIGYATAGVCGLRPAGYSISLPIVARSETAPSCSPYYTDSFNDPSSGWPVHDNSNRRYAYIDGQYQIWVKNPSQGWSVTPGAKVTDFTASVSARRTNGEFGAYGIEFGINEDWSQFYEVLIDANYYSIWRYNNGWTALRNWTSSGAIATGTAWNRIKVVRNGANITLYVNNQLLATVADGSFTGLRRIGLVAVSDDTPLDARFDDFSLYPAACGASATAADMGGAGFEMSEPQVHKILTPPAIGLRNELMKDGESQWRRIEGGRPQAK